MESIRKVMYGFLVLLVCNLVLQVAIEVSLYAQSIPLNYPRNVDLGVAGINFNLRKSSEDVLGTDFVLQSKDSETEMLLCTNQDNSQLLTLQRNTRRGKNSFQNFKVEFMPKEVPETTCHLKEIKTFESFRQVSLGLSVNEVVKIFGTNYRVETKGPITILVYSIETTLNSAFLQHYDALTYNGRYSFRAGKLIEYEMGIQ